MSNKQRTKKADKGKYEGREYLNYEEAGDYLGMKRATLFNYINDLEIKTHKFLRDAHRYLSLTDVKQIEAVKDKPWLANGSVSEKAVTPSVDDTAPFGINEPKSRQKRTTDEFSPIPLHLPLGTISSGVFAKQYGINYTDFKNYMRRGVNGEWFEVEKVSSPTREGYVLKFLTLEQQEKALEVLKRHGKLK